MAGSYVDLFIRAQKVIQVYRLKNVFPVRDLLDAYLELASRANHSLPFLPPELTELIAAELHEKDVRNLAQLLYDHLVQSENRVQLESDEKLLQSIVLHGEILSLLDEYGAEFNLWQLNFTKQILETGGSLEATLVYDNPDEWEGPEFYTESFQVSTLGNVDNVIERLHEAWTTIINDKLKEFETDYVHRARVLDEEWQIPEDDEEREEDYVLERSRGTLFLNGVEFENMRFI